jgi:type VI protein secretion system component VasF
MSDSPTRRKPPPRLVRVLTAHQRRARIIAQLHAQAMATENDRPNAIRTSTVKNAGRGKAEAWFCTVAFLLALGAIVAAGYALASIVPWR